MGFNDKQYFKNSDKGDWQNATNALEEGFDHIVTDSVQFDTTAVEAQAEGKMVWNSVDGTVDLGLKESFLLHLGQQTVHRVVNTTQNTVTKGQAVKIDGSAGDTRVKIALAQANNDANSTTLLGIMANETAKNAEGYVVTEGFVRNFNTSALTEGELVWLSPTVAGGLTTTKPVAPDHLVLLGVCVRQHATTGIIFVFVQNGYELDELHNVKITSPQNGDVLTYNSTLGVWVNQQPA